LLAFGRPQCRATQPPPLVGAAEYKRDLVIGMDGWCTNCTNMAAQARHNAISAVPEHSVTRA
jgi:hypothetical protein